MDTNLKSAGARYVLLSDRVYIDGLARPAAILIENDKIARVCDKSVATWLEAPVYDMGDAFITPGFHDAHQHVFHAALFPSALADEYVGTSEVDYIEHLKEFAKMRPGTGWLLMHGWREALWEVPLVPTKKLVSEAFPDRPVALYSGDSHTLWLNQAGLDELGITDETEAPAGGSFDRDDEGHITGVLREAAGMFYVARVLHSFNTEELMDIYEDYFKRLNAMGITAVCDMALSLIPGADGINPEVFKALDQEGRLSVRSYLFPTLSADTSNLFDMQESLKDAKLVEAPAFKQFFDGVSSQHTAWCGAEYENPRFKGDVGRPTVAPDKMRELVLHAASQGVASRIHTIGDEAVHQAIQIYKEALETYGMPKSGCYTLEHVEDIRPEDIELLAELPIVVSTQSQHITIDLKQPARDLGEWRASRMWPYRELLDKGVTLAFGSDAPVVAPDVHAALYTALTRKKYPDSTEAFYPQHAITMNEAILAYTEGSAKAVGATDKLGSISSGKYADLVIWSHDLREVPIDSIYTTHPLATIVGGRCVYMAN